jgi:hypothetical protein
MKLILPIEAMTEPVALPGPFLRFLGVAEVLGAVGLILPGLLRVRPGLTPLAAAGLVIIMVGATVISAASGGIAAATVPFVTGVLATLVAYGRWRLAPSGVRRRGNRDAIDDAANFHRQPLASERLL